MHLFFNSSYIYCIYPPCIIKFFGFTFYTQSPYNIPQIFPVILGQWKIHWYEIIFHILMKKESCLLCRYCIWRNGHPLLCINIMYFHTIYFFLWIRVNSFLKNLVSEPCWSRIRGLTRVIKPEMDQRTNLLPLEWGECPLFVEG